MRRLLKAALTLNIAIIILISNHALVSAGPGGGTPFSENTSIPDPKTEEM